MEPIDVFAIRDTKQLRTITLDDFRGRMVSEEEFEHIFRLCDALWLHSGDPADPHAELTSGKCSNGFVDVLRALKFSNVCDILGGMLVAKLTDESRYLEKHDGVIDWVVGSDHAGAAISHSVAMHIGAQHDFTEKGPDKTQLWRRFPIQPGEVVLQVEELMTTTGTVMAVREGIRAGNPHPITFAPVVMTLVHRSDVYEIEGSPILYYVHYDIKTWDPSECPLCAQGSSRLRPKTHWAELTKPR